MVGDSSLTSVRGGRLGGTPIGGLSDGAAIGPEIFLPGEIPSRGGSVGPDGPPPCIISSGGASYMSSGPSSLNSFIMQASHSLGYVCVKYAYMHFLGGGVVKGKYYWSKTAMA